MIQENNMSYTVKPYSTIPDIYYDGSLYNPCIHSPNAPYALFFGQTFETISADTEGFKSFLENAVKQFRQSPTYKMYKGYLVDMGLNRCQMLGNIDADMATLEMHHNGITVFDIAMMICYHILNEKGVVTTYDIVLELKRVHRENKVPLVMLCKTAHQLYHNEDDFFIPANMTYGFWTDLITEFRDGITYGVANKIRAWINLSLKHSNNDNLNRQYFDLRDQILDWSVYNEYAYCNNGTNCSNSFNCSY